MADVLHWTRVEPMPARPRRRRHRRTLWVGLAVALTLVTAAVTGYEYAHRYQPWQFGEEGQWQGYHIVGITDGTRETGLIDTAPTGTLGWIGTTQRLSGRYSVRVLEPTDQSDYPGDVTLRWQVDRYRMAASPDTATSRPVVVHPGEVLTVWVLVTRPVCHGDGFESLTSASFRWEALGARHVRTFPISEQQNAVLPLYLCYSKDALNHLYKL